MGLGPSWPSVLFLDTQDLTKNFNDLSGQLLGQPCPSRIDGFALGFVMKNIANLSDKKFCIDAIQKHIELFGTAPRIYGFDRGGHSSANIKTIN